MILSSDYAYERQLRMAKADYELSDPRYRELLELAYRCAVYPERCSAEELRQHKASMARSRRMTLHTAQVLAEAMRPRHCARA